MPTPTSRSSTPCSTSSSKKGSWTRRSSRDRTSGYAALAENVQKFSPEAMAPICGIDAQTIREVARLYATSKGSMILWGMGISQHVHGTDNARCLIALALSTGQIGKPGSGLHPLRGQNNVQGASDSGLIPMFYPDYQRVNTPEARARFEKLWKTELDPDPGLTVVEIMNAAKKHEIRGMYIMGENPAMSDPDVDHAREAMATLDHLVVQDIFLTETAYLADVVLPATAWPEKVGTVTNTDRMVQLGRKAIEPPGDAREDFWLLVELARRMGLDWQYTHPREVFNEMRLCMDSIAGITWERLEAAVVGHVSLREGRRPGRPGGVHRALPDGRPVAAKFVPADLISAAERPGRGVPDGAHHRPAARTLAHRVDDAPRVATSTTSSPNRSPPCIRWISRALGVAPGGMLTIASRRGSISLYARADDGMPRGAVFVPFCYYEAAANMLTNPVLDPFGKIPEFKYCAVKVTAGGDVPGANELRGRQRFSRTRCRRTTVTTNVRTSAGCMTMNPTHRGTEALRPIREFLGASLPLCVVNE